MLFILSLGINVQFFTLFFYIYVTVYLSESYYIKKGEPLSNYLQSWTNVIVHYYCIVSMIKK